jgi:hypothetical protein
MMKASIDCASTATSGVFAKVDKNAILAAGLSCGGIEAYEQAHDALAAPRNMKCCSSW